MFSALVVKLSQSSWEPDQDSRYRNHITFHTDGVFPVELLVHPAYLEFRIRIADYSEENPEEVHQFCMKVCKTVVDKIKSVLDLYEHTKMTKFQLGFYCLGSFQADGQPHFSGCLPRQNYTNPKSFLCSKSPRCQDQCRLPHKFTIWFEYWTVRFFCRCFICLVLTLCIVRIYNHKPSIFYLFIFRTRRQVEKWSMRTILAIRQEQQVTLLIMICLTVFGIVLIVIATEVCAGNT